MEIALFVWAVVATTGFGVAIAKYRQLRTHWNQLLYRVEDFGASVDALSKSNMRLSHGNKEAIEALHAVSDRISQEYPDTELAQFASDIDYQCTTGRQR